MNRLPVVALLSCKRQANTGSRALGQENVDIRVSSATSINLLVQLAALLTNKGVISKAELTSAVQAAIDGETDPAKRQQMKDLLAGLLPDLSLN